MEEKINMKQQVIVWMKKDEIICTDKNIERIFKNTMFYFECGNSFYSSYLKALYLFKNESLEVEISDD